mmetsp:Transcript_4311/g.14318  ORF Transcript_4311/g.14318 Transcript_4311/m.14318 type:complete len:203 (+) Transcript_4311:271-879(+)
MFGAVSYAAASNGLRRYETVDDIPAVMFRKRATVRGRVTRVTDGDTVRVRHEPRLRSAPRESLKVRLMAVDAPETAKWGNEGQPLGETAKAFVEDRLADKRVTVKLLSRDRYGRAVGRVTYRGGLWNLRKRDIQEELLANGLASVYRGRGAQYDDPANSSHHWDAIEAHAKKRQLGIWKDIEANDPAKYKAKIRRKQEKINK